MRRDLELYFEVMWYAWSEVDDLEKEVMRDVWNKECGGQENEYGSVRRNELEGNIWSREAVEVELWNKKCGEL